MDSCFASWVFLENVKVCSKKFISAVFWVKKLQKVEYIEIGLLKLPRVEKI